MNTIVNGFLLAVGFFLFLVALLVIVLLWPAFVVLLVASLGIGLSVTWLYFAGLGNTKTARLMKKEAKGQAQIAGYVAWKNSQPVQTQNEELEALADEVLGMNCNGEKT